mmetsp:Transcript_33442/g.48426  ORF Transcript_33442/g.48426 Transcript_33442/m.48426 type:complete len:89 (-) Transcript_33442:494-760(-)
MHTFLADSSPLRSYTLTTLNEKITYNGTIVVVVLLIHSNNLKIDTKIRGVGNLRHAFAFQEDAVRALPGEPPKSYSEPFSLIAYPSGV